MSHQNKYVIGMNGIDNTGKSTLSDLLNQYICKLDKCIVYTPPHFSRLSTYFPKNESETVDWLKNAPREEVVKGIVDGCGQRNKLIKDSGVPYILVDRGYFSVVSSCAARLPPKASQQESIKNALLFADEGSFIDVGEIPFLLETSLQDTEFIHLLENRINQSFEKDYAEYLMRFRKNLVQIFPNHGRRLDILETPEILVKDVVRSLEASTDLRYRGALHDFLDRLENEHNIRSVLLTGSLSTNSIQLDWSDIDLLCVTYTKSDNTIKKIKCIAGDVKKEYNIDIAPWVVNVGDLGKSIREHGKIRYVFFEKSEARCVYGINDYSHLVNQGLVTSLAFEDGSRLLQAGRIRCEQFREGQIPLSKVYAKNLKMCFNVVKSSLLGKGIFCPAYQDIYLKAKETYPEQDCEYLQELIHQKQGFKGLTEKEMHNDLTKQIKFSSQFLEYAQNRRN